MLEFVLIACISTCDVDQTQQTLIYGRNNTFLLSVTKDQLQIALRMTEEDGPAGGDLQLLRVLIEKQTVVKPIKKSPSSPQLKMRDQLLANPRSDKQEKHLIKAMKLAAGFGMKQIIHHDKKEFRRQKTVDVNS